MAWQSVDTAPRDGTWILLRGRNAVDRPMIPVVIAWCPPGATYHGWSDSGSLRNMDSLAASPGADWHPLP